MAKLKVVYPQELITELSSLLENYPDREIVVKNANRGDLELPNDLHIAIFEIGHVGWIHDVMKILEKPDGLELLRKRALTTIQLVGLKKKFIDFLAAHLPSEKIPALL